MLKPAGNNIKVLAKLRTIPKRLPKLQINCTYFEWQVYPKHSRAKIAGIEILEGKMNLLHARLHETATEQLQCNKYCLTVAVLLEVFCLLSYSA